MRAVTAIRVLICIGAGGVACTPDPLVRQLLADGHAVADAHGLGLRTAALGALLDARGRTSQTLFTLGGLRRGELWESTAVGEIRDQ